MSWDPDLLVCANLSLSIKGAGKGLAGSEAVGSLEADMKM